MLNCKIDRTKWARGGNPKYGPSRMLNAEGCKCCLGHLASQVYSIPDDELKECGEPNECIHKDTVMTEMVTEVIDDEDGPYKKTMSTDTNFTCAAIEINDDTKIEDSVRESKLTNLFKENGIKLEFFNGPAAAPYKANIPIRNHG